MQRNPSNQNIDRRQGLGLEKLEDRVCLTVSAALTPAGSLAVTGDADGTVEIRAVDTDTFDVFDDSQLVATIAGVTKDIGIRIDQNAPDASSNDEVLIRLGEESVRKVSANLGHGDNALNISGQSEIGRLTYRGGLGNDAVASNVAIDHAIQMFGGAGEDSLAVNQDATRIYFRGGRGGDSVGLSENVNANIVGVALGQGENEFGSDATIGRMLNVRGGASTDIVRVGGAVDGLLKIKLGHGDNQLDLNGQVDGFAYIRAGSGNDTVHIGADAQVTHHAGILLGHGDNQFNLNGSVGSLFVAAGEGADNFNLGESSRVRNHTAVVMGHGENNLRVHGELSRSLFVWAGRGNDDVLISETSAIGGSVLGLLGDGENRFLHAGLIEGDLTVLSKNAQDQFAVTGTVLGSTNLDPGGQ